jgi:hypothetical protein
MPSLDTVIYCANPQCHQPIRDADLVYSAERHEAYHNNDCPMYANALRVMETNKPQALHVKLVSLEEATNLLAQGLIVNPERPFRKKKKK